MTQLTLYATRGKEFARAGSHDGNEVRLVPTMVGGRTEMLPDDPRAVAKILRDRKAKQTPAQRAKSKMAAALKKRGF